MQNARRDEAQAGIKIAGRNINNLRYADDTTLIAESEEELKSLLMKVKEESEKVGLSSTFRTRHGTTDWFQFGKGVCQGCILSPCLFNLYAEYIMQNAGLDEAQAGIKIARRNINKLRYADDTNIMAGSEEELKSLLMKVKEESEKLA